MAKKVKAHTKAVGTIGGLALAGEVLGKALGQLAKDVVDNFMADDGKGKKKHKKDREARPDVAARVFKALADGPRSVGELVEVAGGCMSRLLRVLADARALLLVEVQEDGDKVSLTRAGERAAQAVREKGIKKSAARLLD